MATGNGFLQIQSITYETAIELTKNKKKSSTHPVSPVTCIITIRLTIEILHAAGDQIRFAFIPELQPLPRMLFISKVNH